MQSCGQEYCSIAEETLAALSENGVLPETLQLTADVPNWSDFEYCTPHGRMWDARRFSGMFSDSRSRTMMFRRSVRRHIDIGV